MQFTLKGSGNSKELEFNPPVLFFDESLLIQKEYKHSVKLLKKSEGACRYKLRLEGKNDQDFQVSLMNLTDHSVCNGSEEITCDLDEDEFDLEITVKSDSIGEKTAYFTLEPEDGFPISLSISANFTGPLIQIFEPSVYFGLQNINETERYRINVQNISDIPAPVLIKDSKNIELTFINHTVLNEYTTPEGNSYKFSEDYKVIEPQSSCEFEISFKSVKPEKIHENLEIMVLNGES